MSHEALDRRLVLGALGGAAGLAAVASIAKAGPLTPPAGAVRPTPGPEPRTPINSTNTPGDSGAVFRITKPGSYFLEDDVVAPSGIIAILIGLVTPGPVTIDGRGFTLKGHGSGKIGLRVEGNPGGPSSFSIQRLNVEGFIDAGLDFSPGGRDTAIELEDILVSNISSGPGVAMLLLPAVQKVREAAARVSCRNCFDGVRISGVRQNGIDTFRFTDFFCDGSVRYAIVADQSMTAHSAAFFVHGTVAGCGTDAVHILPAMVGGRLLIECEGFTAAGNGGIGVHVTPTATANARVGVAVRASRLAGNAIGMGIGGTMTDSRLDAQIIETHAIANAEGLRLYTSGGRNAIGNLQLTRFVASHNTSDGLELIPEGGSTHAISVDACSITDNGAVGLRFQPPGSASAVIDVRASHLTGNVLAGAWLNGQASFIARDSVFAANGGDGIAASGVINDVRLERCQVHANAGAGLRAALSAGPAGGRAIIAVRESELRANTLAGLDLSGVQGGEITANSLTANGQGGLRCRASSAGLSITDNNALNNGPAGGLGVGIEVAGGGNLILRNTARGQGTPGIGGGNFILSAASASGPVLTGAALATATNPIANWTY